MIVGYSWHRRWAHNGPLHPSLTRRRPSLRLAFGSVPGGFCLRAFSPKPSAPALRYRPFAYLGPRSSFISPLLGHGLREEVFGTTLQSEGLRSMSLLPSIPEPAHPKRVFERRAFIRAEGGSPKHLPAKCSGQSGSQGSAELALATPPRL